jgi:replicative DNA helicase
MRMDIPTQKPSVPSPIAIEASTEQPRSEWWLVSHLIVSPERMADALTAGVDTECFIGSQTKPVFRVLSDLHEDGSLGSTSTIKSALQERGDWKALATETQSAGEIWSRLLEDGAPSAFSDADAPRQRGDWVYHTQRLLQGRELRLQMMQARRLMQEGMNSTLPVRDRCQIAEDVAGSMMNAQARAVQTKRTTGQLARGLSARIGQGAPARVPLGFPSVDGALVRNGVGGIRSGRYSVLAALTSHGKTLFADWVCLNTAMRLRAQGREGVVIKFDLEQGVEENEDRFAVMCTNLCIPERDIMHGAHWITGDEIQRHIVTGDPFDEDWKHRAFEKGLQLMDDLSDYLVIDVKSGASPAYIRSRVLAENQRAPTKLVCVDYIHLMQHKGLSGEELYSTCASQLHSLMKETQAAGLIAAQIHQRAVEKVTPIISDIKWSTALAEGAHAVLMLDDPLQKWKQRGRERYFSADSDHGPNDLRVLVPKNKGAQKEVILRRYKHALRVYDPQDPEDILAPPTEEIEDDAPF